MPLQLKISATTADYSAATGGLEQLPSGVRPSQMSARIQIDFYGPIPSRRISQSFHLISAVACVALDPCDLVRDTVASIPLSVILLQRRRVYDHAEPPIQGYEIFEPSLLLLGEQVEIRVFFFVGTVSW